MAGDNRNSPRRGSGERASGSQGTKFTILMAVIVLVYILPRIVSFMLHENVGYVVAKTGTMQEKTVIDGVITRKEQLCTSVASGVVEYYYPGSSALSKNTVVCTIRDNAYYGDLLDQKLTDINAEIASLSDNAYSEDFQKLEQAMEQEVADFQRQRDLGRYDSVYQLKNSLEASVRERQELYSLLAGSQASRLLQEQGVYQDVQSESSENLWISEAGIIAYSYDGYEGWDPSLITPDFFDDYDGKYEHLNINMQEVKPNDPLYRLVTSQKWNITAFLTEEQAKLLNQDESATITFSINGSKPLTGSIVTLEETAGKKYKLVIEMSSRVQTYMDERIVTLSIEEGTYEGLKLPNSCLVSQEYYRVPAACVFRSENRSGLMKRTEQGDEFVEVDFAWSDEDFYYFRLPDTLTEGTVLLKQESEETETLSAKESGYGVYLTNGGGREFCRVDVLYQDKNYAIVDGISPYDHVLLNNE